MADEDGDSEGVIRRNRFSGGPARGFMSNLTADERILKADLAIDRAHIVIFMSQDITEPEVASEVLVALDEVEAVDHDTLLGDEDAHGAIGAVVIDIINPDDERMHTARSRNDEVTTCIRYHLREDMFSALDAALALRESLLETVATYTKAIMSGCTHLQPVQPTTVVHFLLSYERTVVRDRARLMCTYERINQSPLGPVAFVGAPFDVNRELTTDLPGFDHVIENSMGVSTTHDFLAETLSVLTTHVVTLSSPAVGLVTFSSKGLVELLDDYSSTSSIIP